MEFPSQHSARHDQMTVLHDDLPVRYAVLQTQYQTLQREMLDYKTKAHYWQAQFSNLNSTNKCNSMPAGLS